MAIQAIIIAGGAGTRLRPLTCACPKPLAPLCGAPIMDYTLQLLCRHGFFSANVTLWYRPQDIKNQFGSQRHGVKLTYTVEDRPAGTAGSVLLAAGQGKDTVLVLSGDGLTSRSHAHIWPGVRIPDDAVIAEPMRETPNIIIDDGKAAFASPNQITLAAPAFLAQTGKGGIAVMHDGEGLYAYHTVLGALSAYECVHIAAMGPGTEGMLAYAVSALKADGGILCRKSSLLLLSQHGLPLEQGAFSAL